MTGSARTATDEAAGAGRYAVLGVFLAGLRRGNPGAVVNALVSFAVTALPTFLERRYGVKFRPWQRLYLNGGMLVHAVGMLGPYDDVWWWDHLTHLWSATLVGGLIHAVTRRSGRDPRRRVLAFVLGGGVLWELVEYAVHGASRRIGLEPLLVPYGRRDTLLDLLFDLLGALLVLASADRLLANLVDDPESGERR